MWSGVCPHDRTEEVKTYGGTTIAIRCKSCTTILCEVGDCDGCSRREVRLSKVNTRTKERFHSEDCWKATMAARRAVKAQAPK